VINGSINQYFFLVIYIDNCMEEKIFKILCVDGGGIKGLYSLYVLQEFEKNLCQQGSTLSDYFDMICGTSTGGLIALGIACGYPTGDIIKLYENNANMIFPNDQNKSWLGKKIATICNGWKQLTGSKYGSEVLTKVADGFFEKKTMNDSKNLLCIPSFQIGTNTNIVFKYPHNEALSRYGPILMRDVALATSAAPTYFPPHNIESDNLSGYFVDGGVWANNPTLVGVTEAIKYFVGPTADKPYKKYDVLSIGNINVNKTDILSNPNTYWNMKKIVDLLDLLMNSCQRSTCIFSKHLCQQTGGNLTRIECTNFPYTNALAMDNSNSDFLEALKTFGKSDGVKHLNEGPNCPEEYNIKRFFLNKKTYMTKN